MDMNNSTGYQRGDRVILGRPAAQRSGRVLSVHPYPVPRRGDNYFNPSFVAHSKLRITTYSTVGTRRSGRLIPPRTPVIVSAEDDNLRTLALVSHDPNWDPFAIVPPLRPDQYTCLVDRCRVNGSRQLNLAGAYFPASRYQPGDPVWAWDNAWRAATVFRVDRSWIKVQIVDGHHKSRHGVEGTTFGVQAPSLWPVLEDRIGLHLASPRTLPAWERWAHRAATPGLRTGGWCDD